MIVILTTLFGVESLTADELTQLGYDRDKIQVSDGQLRLRTNSVSDAIEAVARCNVFIRTAERVLLQLGAFEAKNFDAFFDLSAEMPWEEWIEPGAAFVVKGYSRKSALFGIPACQRLLKKAIVQRLLKAQGLSLDSRLPENPDKGMVRIQFGIVSDQVSLMVDTSGDGLHKRGYRPLLHEAPIKETLAAAMIKVSRYRPFGEEAFYDPFCGSGTLPIEAAMMAFGIAPGMNRPFGAEQWPFIGKKPFDRAREEALSVMDLTAPDEPFVFGSDISPKAVEIARANAKRAGVGDMIRFRTSDLFKQDLGELRAWTVHEKLLVVCNPPYGERLLDQNQAEQLYGRLGQVFLDQGMARQGIRLSVITPDEQFEQIAGGRADKRRKLYNGMIKCTLYHYFKQRRDIQ